MNLKGALQLGLYALPVLIVAFAVLLGASTVARALGDEVAAVAMVRVALALVLLLTVDLILLVGILAIRALDERDERDS